MTAACPECGGPQMFGHPHGLLALRHTNECTVRAREDGTVLLDHDLARGRRIVRPSTTTERTLLAHLGYTLPDELPTIVTPLTASQRNRSWPTITLESTDD